MNHSQHRSTQTKDAERDSQRHDHDWKGQPKTHSKLDETARDTTNDWKGQPKTRSKLDKTARDTANDRPRRAKRREVQLCQSPVMDNENSGPSSLLNVMIASN